MPYYSNPRHKWRGNDVHLLAPPFMAGFKNKVWGALAKQIEI